MNRRLDIGSGPTTNSKLPVGVEVHVLLEADGVQQLVRKQREQRRETARRKINRIYVRPAANQDGNGQQQRQQKPADVGDL